MGEQSNISWTDGTWNPWLGCDKVGGPDSECANCYIDRQLRRMHLEPWGRVYRAKGTWGLPDRMQRKAVASGKRLRLFTCSLSDFFHRGADEWRPEAWEIIRRCPDVDFLILTKRAHRIAQCLPADWSDGWPNVWLGVSVGRMNTAHRIDKLRQISAKVRFVSAEPLLESLACINLDKIHWLIAGGESDSHYRPMDLGWAEELRQKCEAGGVAFFFKQIAGKTDSQGADVLGRVYHDWPQSHLVQISAPLPPLETEVEASPIPALESNEPGIFPASPEVMTDDALAVHVRDGIRKFSKLVPYVRELKKRFAALPRGKANIMGCQTWTQFCEAVLDRSDSAIRKALASKAPRAGNASTLAERFTAPPFSILDAKQGHWQERKRAWLALGINDEEGRGEEHEAVYNTKILEFESRTNVSTFDAALAETMYRWFAPVGGHVLDPFAGGSTRGIIAAKLGHSYTGIELRAEQVEDNRKQAEQIGVAPTWICADSANLSGYVANQRFDLIFTCPPYFDLERYTESNSRDGSTLKTYDAFMLWFEFVFRQAVERLKQDRFLVVVVGEIRDEKGFYRNLVGEAVSCFQRLGLHYYNELILTTPLGSLPVRNGNQFTRYRKVQKAHQNVLVFWKGDDAKRIPEALGVLDAPELRPVEQAAA